MLSLFGLGLGLARTSVAPAGPRAFSTTSVAQLLKSHSGAKKRFRLTGGGAYKRVRTRLDHPQKWKVEEAQANAQSQAGKQHLNTGFSGSRINRLGKAAYTSPSQTKTIRRLLAGRK